MTRSVTLAGYAVIAIGAVVVHLAARRSSRLATFPDAVRLVRARTPARWLVLAGWLWLGWHVFARASHPG